MAGSRKRPNTPKRPVAAKRKASALGGRSSGVHQIKRFPLQDIHELLETKFPDRTVKAEAAVYLTGILEYIGTEILELSSNVARARTSSSNSQLKVTLEDMVQAIESDAEMKELVDKVRKENFDKEQK